MTGQELLRAQREQLAAVVRASFGEASHVDAFAARILGEQAVKDLIPSFSFCPPTIVDEARYSGYPQVAYMGFGLGTGRLSEATTGSAFLAGLRQLQHRSEQRVADFATDDIALLGVADGLACLMNKAVEAHIHLRDWLVQIIDRGPQITQWSNRTHALAGDLLDGRGRLQASPNMTSVDALALEFALRATYPQSFATSPLSSTAQQHDLLTALLTEIAPLQGELDRASIWFAALSMLVDAAVVGLIPTSTDVIRLLENVQHALKRWPWKSTARRGIMPTRWLIDDEYDVQSLLWTILYPIYGADLLDETYLSSWGNMQGRIDLAVRKLKLIIEIKIVREVKDFTKIEEEIAGDLGVYFKELNHFDHMIAFIYDDCDQHQPERYDGLRNALMQRERIEGVVIMRRPSMIPNRHSRSIPAN